MTYSDEDEADTSRRDLLAWLDKDERHIAEGNLGNKPTDTASFDVDEQHTDASSSDSSGLVIAAVGGLLLISGLKSVINVAVTATDLWLSHDLGVSVAEIAISLAIVAAGLWRHDRSKRRRD